MVFDDLEQMVNELPRVFDLDRRRVRDARGRALRRRRAWSTNTSPSIGVSWRLIVPDADRSAAPASCRWRPDRPRHLRAPRRRVAGVRRDARAASPTPAPASSCCARRAAKAGSVSDPSLVPDGDLGRRARPRAASRPPAVLGIAEVIVLDHPDGDLRWADVPELHAEIVAADRALSAGRRHHLRRGRALLASRSHRRPRADLHRGAVARRRRAAALLRDDAGGHHARGRRSRARQGWAPPDSSFWGIAAGRVRRTAPSRRPSSSTSATGCRASWRRCAATGRRWGPHNPIAWIDEDEARRWLGLEQFRAIAARRHRRSDARASRRAPACGLTRSTSSACPYCGGRLALVDSVFHRRDGDEIHDGILGCHCCVFPGRRRHPGAASAARRVDWRANSVEAGRPDLARRARCSASTTTSRRRRFDAVASSGTATYRDTVDALGPNFEGGYFLYRFSDPTYIVAQAVARAVGAARARRRRRAIDICGGSGHVTRSLLDLSGGAAGPCRPVLREGVAGAALHGARAASRSAATATRRCRSRAAPSASRCAPMRSCTSGRSGSSSARWSASSTAAPQTATPAPCSSVTRTTSARGARRTASRCRRKATRRCSRRSRRESSAKPASSRTSCTAGRWTWRGATIRQTLDSDPALTIIASRNPACSRRIRCRSRRRRRRGAADQPALRRRGRWRPAPPAARVPVRRLRAGIRRLPAVSAGGADARSLGAGRAGDRAWSPAICSIWSGARSSSICRSVTTRDQGLGIRDQGSGIRHP